MKTHYWLLAVVALLFWRHHNDAATNGITRTDEAVPDDGSNPLSDMWGLLSGKGLSSPNFQNAANPGQPNADPGGNAAAKLGLNPAWDGSLP